MNNTGFASKNEFQSVLFVYNSEKPKSVSAVELVQSILSKKNITIQTMKNWVRGECSEAFTNTLLTGIQWADIVMVFGGDGTILGVARVMAHCPKPIFGINMGSFGFLTTSQSQTIGQDIEQLLNGNYRIIPRFLLEAWVMRDHEKVFHSYALNESLVTLLRPGRLINVRLVEEEKPGLAYRCDGVIIATPTGSSGHSLSAGGPILEPHLAALVITPVSPHSLFNRPLVVDGQREICLQFHPDQNDKVLILDGQIHFPLQNEDSVFVRRSECTVPAISLPHLNFTTVLNHKFHLGNEDWIK